MTIRTESAAYVSHITLMATEAITDILICLLGFLSIAWWIFFLTGRTFADFQSAIPIVACIAVGFVLIMRRSVRRVNNKSQSVAVLNFRQILLITLSIIIAFVSLRLTNNWFFWISITISAALMIALVYRLGEPHSSGHVNFYIETDEGHLLPLIGLAIGAAIIALIAHRPDADDTTYGLPLIFLHRSTVPLNRIAEIHNANALVAYYAIIAYAEIILGIPLLQIYYMIMPAVFSFISLFIFYRLFSTLGSGSPLLFTFFLFIILILWGDTHRSPGNFA